MQAPLKGNPAITQKFGENGVDYSQFGLKGHHGVDYGVATGTPVHATENGKVEFSANGVTDKYTGRFAAGETIVINGTSECWYMHLSKRLVGAGAKVSVGQLIGYSGATGFVTGPHLHFGVRPFNPNIGNGYRGFIDPLKVITAATKPSAPAQGGDMTKTQATAFVDTVARISFGKAIDKGGMDNYVGHLLAGRYTPQRVLTEIYNSQQAKDYRAKTYTKTVTKVVEKVVEKPGTGSNADISHIRQVVDKIWALISKVFK